MGSIMPKSTAKSIHPEPRNYSSFKSEEKTEMYLDAQNKISDNDIMIKFNCDEDTLIKCLNDVFIQRQKQQGYSKVFTYK